MLPNSLELILRNAISLATSQRHEYVTYEHLLLSLLDDHDVKNVLLEHNVAIKSLSESLKTHLKNTLSDSANNKIFKESKPTSGFQRVIQRAVLHCQANGDKLITGAHILAEFFLESETFALTYLKSQHLNRQKILLYIKSINNKSPLPPESKNKSDLMITNQSSIGNKNQSNHTIKIEASSDYYDEQSEEELLKYCINLNEKAKKEAIDCLVGRETEIQRVIEVLCRRKKNNALLVGEPGVGKTAIAEGLATKIIENKVPALLKNYVIYSLDIGNLVAGTKYRGDFEERVKIMLEILRNRTNSILFIDEIHTIIGAGATTSGALDASNLLKPALAKGELRCIGSTTFKEYHNYFEKDMALIRRFQKVTVLEPDDKESLQILRGLKGYYEKHHNVIYDDSALEASITLSRRYIHDRHLPDKAIDLLDEAGAHRKIDFKSSEVSVIRAKDIEELLTSILKIPNISANKDDIKSLKGLESSLKKQIFGQDEAIKHLCSSIKLSRAGLKKGSRPVGCYLFSGPTGVGKTELAKQLASFCHMKLTQFDMSEYSESNAVAKLIGSPPGYVGFDQGGSLTSEIDKHPYSVILFDEIEKANHEIYNLLLQIMDEGKLTDSTGKVVNFSHSMVILTSNLISIGNSSIGFNNKNQPDKQNTKAIDDKFSPEFLSRLDRVILFSNITDIFTKIFNKNLKELEGQLHNKGITIHVNKNVKNHLIEVCKKQNKGARGLDREIESQLKQRLAEEILFGKLKHGGSVSVDLDKKNGILIFIFGDQKNLPTTIKKNKLTKLVNIEHNISDESLETT